jgi:hypothetical protein
MNLLNRKSPKKESEDVQVKEVAIEKEKVRKILETFFPEAEFKEDIVFCQDCNIIFQEKMILFIPNKGIVEFHKKTPLDLRNDKILFDQKVYWISNLLEKITLFSSAKMEPLPEKKILFTSLKDVEDIYEEEKYFPFNDSLFMLEEFKEDDVKEEIKACLFQAKEEGRLVMWQSHPSFKELHMLLESNGVDCSHYKPFEDVFCDEYGMLEWYGNLIEVMSDKKRAIALHKF